MWVRLEPTVGNPNMWKKDRAMTPRMVPPPFKVDEVAAQVVPPPPLTKLPPETRKEILLKLVEKVAMQGELAPEEVAMLKENTPGIRALIEKAAALD